MDIENTDSIEIYQKMNKIKFTTYLDGEITSVKEYEVTSEQLERIKNAFSEIQAKKDYMKMRPKQTSKFT